MFRSSVRFHRWLLVASVLVPALLFGFFAWQSRQNAYREGTETTDRTAAILVEHARKVFETVDLILDRVAFQLGVSERLGGDIADLSRGLHELASRYNQIISIWVSDANGFVVAGSQPWEPGGSVAARDFFVTQRSGDVGTYISGIFVGRATNSSSFAVSRRRSSVSGAFEGTIHVALSPNYFAEFFAETSPRLPGSSSLIRADGEVLARNPALERRRLPANNMLGDAIAREPNRGRASGLSNNSGVERILAYRKVGDLPLYSTFAVNRSDIDRQWLQSLPGVGAGSAIAALILLMTSWLALRRARAEEQALTQLREETAQRHLTEERMKRTQRLEAIGQLTGGVAHDFNNLLMVVLGNAERLLHRDMDPKHERSVRAIITAAQNGERLNRQLLAFARRQSLMPEIVDLPVALTDMEDMISTSLRGAVDYKIDAAPETWRTKVDVGELRLAVLNLVVNARDAMPQGGTVTIETTNATVDPHHPIEGRHGDFAVVSITDAGHGMPPDVAAKVFEPFFTTKPVGYGTGLGLSQVHGFSIQSGGAVSIDTEVSRGTTILLYLPRSLDEPHVSEPASQTAVLRSGTVLLVEDDASVAEVTRGYLEQLGYAVIDARSADEALHKLRAGLHVDLVLSDIVMPGSMSGIEMARAIQKETPNLPLVLMTGYNRSQENLADGGFVVILKPFSSSDIQLAVDKVLSPSRRSAVEQTGSSAETRV